MKPHNLHLTQQGLDELKSELDDLENNKLPKAIERVKLAREQGDLSENSEYHAARDDHAFIQGRVDELHELIAKARIVKKTSSNGKVSLGSKVTVTSDKGHSLTYHIVGKYEANPIDQKISDESPLGQALLGKKVGEKVEYEAPVGKIVYSIDKIH